jgi:transcriptional regulator with XRE-family HTH domain
MSDKSFSALFEAAASQDEYWTEKAIAEFTEDLSRWMEHEGMTRADLASALGVSQPYITKALKGNANFTLASMTKLARAVGAVVQARLVPEAGPKARTITATVKNGTIEIPPDAKRGRC